MVLSFTRIAHQATDTEKPGRLARLLAGVLVVGVVVGLGVLVQGLYPADLDTPSDPSFLDSIFDNRGVIWAARLLLVSAALVLAVGGVFIVASTVVWMKNRQWIRRAGPFEVAEEAVGQLADQVEFWKAAAQQEQDEKEELKRQLEESGDLIEQLQQAMDTG